MARRVGISQSRRETTYWNNQTPPVAAPPGGAGECPTIWQAVGGVKELTGLLTPGPGHGSDSADGLYGGTGGPPRRMTAEERRLKENQDRSAHWRRWGPYLSERQWGTVREDYSPHGTAWEFFPHDHARSRAYRWGEDGLAGISDNHQRLCFALALWNERDSDPQGAPLRPDRQRGQPRRGRQGVLLLPRLHADPLLHEVAVQVPAGGLSLRASSSRRTAGATARSRSTSCSTPASSRATATSTSSSSTPRPRPTTC